MRMRVLIQRARVVAVVVGLRELVLQQYEVRRIRTARPQPDPGLGNVGVRVVAPVNNLTVVVAYRMFLSEQVVLDPANIFSRKMTTVGARMISENPSHVVDIAVVTPEAFVGVVSPFECGEIVTRPDHTAGIDLRWAVGNPFVRGSLGRLRVRGAIVDGTVHRRRNGNRDRLRLLRGGGAERIADDLGSPVRLVIAVRKTLPGFIFGSTVLRFRKRAPVPGISRSRIPSRIRWSRSDRSRSALRDMLRPSGVARARPIRRAARDVGSMLTRRRARGPLGNGRSMRCLGNRPDGGIGPSCMDRPGGCGLRTRSGPGGRWLGSPVHGRIGCR